MACHKQNEKTVNPCKTGKVRYNGLIHYVLYLFFGVLTTLVNVVAYWCCRRIPLSLVSSTAIAWFLSVLFAWVTNRAFVFHSRSVHIIKEIGLFFSSRIVSGIVDIALMAFFVSVLQLPEIPTKIIDNVVIIVLNYIFSRFVVFKGKGSVDSQREDCNE